MSQKLNIANFICKFGENIVLLDMLREVVIPAFKEPMQRTYGTDVRYFFHGVKIVDLTDQHSTEIAISGRFVKEAKVGRDQVFANGEIVKDHRELDTAPTSFFVLLLSNHKLLYVRETAGAPGINAFESTIGAFVKQQYRTWLDKECKRRDREGNPTTKKKLMEEVSTPNVEIVELSTDAEIRAFVKKFKVINSVEVQLLSTNHETDNSPLFKKLRGVQGRLGSDQLTIKNTKNGDAGLSKADVVDLVAGQAEEANSRIVIRGRDLEGEKLNAMNDHFKLSINVPDIPSDVTKAAKALFETFQKQIRLGMVHVHKAPGSAIRILTQMRGLLRQ